MPDYKEMYLELSRAVEKAVRILIAAQQECEEMYISSEPEIGVVDFEAVDFENEDFEKEEIEDAE